MSNRNRKKQRQQRQAERQQASPTERPTVPAQTNNAVGPLLLTVMQVCELLQISRSTLDRMARDGEPPGRVKLGGKVRYHRETLEGWLRDRVTAETA